MKDELDRLARRSNSLLVLAVLSGIPILLVKLGMDILSVVPSEVAFILAIIIPCVAITGGVIVTIAKWPLNRSGLQFTSGREELVPQARKLYKCGLVLVAIGIVGEVGALLAILYRP
jgi:hypothetical protein